MIRRVPIVSLLLFLGSCALFRGVRWNSEHPLRGVERFVHPAGREVIYVPMRHLSSKSGYAAIRRFLDSLKEEGFVTFCEKVMAVPYGVDTVSDIAVREIDGVLEALWERRAPGDSLRLDTLLRKSRRLLGFMLSPEGYADTANASLDVLGRGPEERSGYVSQSDSLLGTTTGRDIWVDYTLADLVAATERRFGEIELTEYDFATPLLSPYRPDMRIRGQIVGYFTLFARNDYLVRRIVASPHPKIAVVYGAAHSYGVGWQLRKFHGFRRDKRYNR